MHIFYSLRKNFNTFAQVVDQDFGLVEEVSSWARDLEALKIIKSQKYKMLMVVYFGDKIDKIDDWIENLNKGNIVMLSFYGDIEQTKERDKT